MDFTRDQLLGATDGKGEVFKTYDDHQNHLLFDLFPGDTFFLKDRQICFTALLDWSNDHGRKLQYYGCDKDPIRAEDAHLSMYVKISSE